MPTLSKAASFIYLFTHAFHKTQMVPLSTALLLALKMKQRVSTTAWLQAFQASGPTWLSLLSWSACCPLPYDSIYLKSKSYRAIHKVDKACKESWEISILHFSSSIMGDCICTIPQDSTTVQSSKHTIAFESMATN